MIFHSLSEQSSQDADVILSISSPRDSPVPAPWPDQSIPVKSLTVTRKNKIKPLSYLSSALFSYPSSRSQFKTNLINKNLIDRIPLLLLLWSMSFPLPALIWTVCCPNKLSKELNRFLLMSRTRLRVSETVCIYLQYKCDTTTTAITWDLMRPMLAWKFASTTFLDLAMFSFHITICN